MKHPNRTDFTAREANQIRGLLAQNASAAREETKTIREEVRKIGFHISLHKLPSRSRFSPDDFDRLIQSGAITVH